MLFFVFCLQVVAIYTETLGCEANDHRLSDRRLSILHDQRLSNISWAVFPEPMLTCSQVPARIRDGRTCCGERGMHAGGHKGSSWGKLGDNQGGVTSRAIGGSPRGQSGVDGVIGVVATWS